MSVRARTVLLALAFMALAPAIWRVAIALPGFGHPTSLYGATVNALVPAARRVSNMVSAVNFDVRGIDTLGEEGMLIAAVTGAVVLLRGSRGESESDKAGRIPGRKVEARPDATVIVCRVFAVATVLFGLCSSLNGALTPGGGFQGGVVVASGLLLLYLGEGYEAWRRLVHGPVLAIFEGTGLLLFVLCAGLPLLGGHAALENRLPLEQFRSLLSGGLLWIVNLGVLLAVTGSFGLLALEFLEETRDPAEGEG